MHNRLSALFTGCEIVSMNSFWQETSCRILRVPASIYVCAYCRGSVLKTVRHFGVSSKMRRWLAMWDRLSGAIRALTGGKRWRGFLQGEPHGYSYIVCPCKKRIRVWMPASIQTHLHRVCLYVSAYVNVLKWAKTGWRSRFSTFHKCGPGAGLQDVQSRTVTKCGWVLSVDSCRGLVVSHEDTLHTTNIICGTQCGVE